MKLLLFGIDGASFSVISPLVAAGKLPNISALINEGVSLVLESTIPTESPTAWSSILTGVNPGKHGVFGFLKRDPGSYNIRPVNSMDVREQNVLKLISSAGKRVIAVSVPLSYPLYPVNGILIPGLMSPRNKGLIGYPKEVVSKLAYLTGNNLPLINSAKISQSKKTLIEDVYQVTNQTMKLASHLIVDSTWDFFMVVLYGTDVLQHFFWDEYLGAKSSEEKKFQDPISSFYIYIDKLLGDLVSVCGSDTQTIVVSDHGAEKCLSYFNLSLFFEKKGLTRINRSASVVAMREIYSLSKKAGIMTYAPRILRKVLPSSLFEAQAIARQGNSIQIDWNSTRAYSYSTETYLNVLEREPNGTIRLGSEYEFARKQLMSLLTSETSSNFKTKIFRNVYKREDLFWGAHVDDAPDILLEPNGFLVSGTNGVHSYRFYNQVEEIPPMLRGTHHPHGIFLTSGPATKSTSLDKIHAYDVGAIILDFLNIDLPDWMDGRPLSQISNKTNRNFVSDLVHPAQSFEWGKEEESELMSQLRSLGYV